MLQRLMTSSFRNPGGNVCPWTRCKNTFFFNVGISLHLDMNAEQKDDLVMQYSDVLNRAAVCR